MKLLTNNQCERGWFKVGHFYIPADYWSHAAIEGPFKKRINVSKVLAVVYVLAAVVVALDLFVWRAV